MNETQSSRATSLPFCASSSVNNPKASGGFLHWKGLILWSAAPNHLRSPSGEKDKIMGRKLMRVPLDFNWPREKPWKGYVNSAGESRVCPDCDGTGESPAFRLLLGVYHGYLPFSPESTGSTPLVYSDEAMQRSVKRKVESNPRFYGTGQEAIEREAARMAAVYNGQWAHHLSEDDVAALIEAGLLKELTHTRTKNGHWRRKKPAYVPSAREVNLWLVENWMGLHHGHTWTVVSAECKRQGYETDCPHCDGGTIWASPEEKRKYEEWERTEPPTGEGYQIWETVTEGSPISPVFARPEDLARWMTRNGWDSDRQTSYQQWMSFILGDGWAPSLLVSGGEVRTGVDALNPEGRRPARTRIVYDEYDPVFGYRRTSGYGEFGDWA